MSVEEKKASSPTEDQDTPRNTIRVIKSGDTDDTVVEVKVAGDSEAKVTVFGGESPKNEKSDKIGEDKIEKEPDNAKKIKEDKKDAKSADDKKTEKEPKATKEANDDKSKNMDTEPPKRISQEEIDRIIKQHSKLSEKQLKKHLDFFWSTDTERYGFFNVQQFANSLIKRGYYFTSREYAEMFIDLDHNNDWLVSLEEYIIEMSKNKRRPRNPEEVKELFQFFDQNGDGYVCRKDIRDTMASLNQTITELCITEFIQQGRSTSDKLDQQDFARAIRYLKI